MVALVIANSVLEKFGGDSVAETKRNLDAYLASIPAVLASFDA
jgi:chorismate synthase